MKLSSRKIADMKSTFLHYPAVAIVLIAAALASSAFAAFAGKEFAHSLRTHNLMSPDAKKGLIKLTKQPVPPADVASLVSVLKENHPSLDIASSAAPGSLVITAGSADDYREWITALGTIQGAGKAGSVWMATELCVGSCGGQAMRAEIQGISQSVSKGS
ncbi:hypothetical protein [Methylibium petroleiphilum]|uniref:Transmembrane protein n=1 Tax=Methylibium petroleiphilum (strain ATCC BAA-1232 / LMG 22953 / PM1) TaxID=420662 RepID=A2SNP9_METPP|nr:hypothetical protein [Methylibium petroleiphilum]ABM97188.1 hypothetical protein Mpe_B0413 [Methylibium petroleiphilum PM1]